MACNGKVRIYACLASASGLSITYVHHGLQDLSTQNGVGRVKDAYKLSKALILNRRKWLAILHYHVHQGLIQPLFSGHCKGDKFQNHYHRTIETPVEVWNIIVIIIILTVRISSVDFTCVYMDEVFLLYDNSCMHSKQCTWMKIYVVLGVRLY